MTVEWINIEIILLTVRECEREKRASGRGKTKTNNSSVVFLSLRFTYFYLASLLNSAVIRGMRDLGLCIRAEREIC
jgi:hypothetical protein